MFPIDVTVVTGFLGSGKTTLINRLLSDPDLRDTAVIVNEFGEVAIDHLLVEKSNDDVIEIAGGCLCCTVRGELTDTLADLIDRLQTGKITALDRIVIETTGMADPIPLLEALQSHPALAQALRIDRVITTVDAVTGLETLDTYEEARHQIVVADLIIVTKTGLADEGAIKELDVRLAEHNGAKVVFEHDLGTSATELLDLDVSSGVSCAVTSKGHHDHHHHTSASTHIVTHPDPLPWHIVAAFLEFLCSRSDPKILRIKGLVQVSEDPARPIVVHGVQRTLSPPKQLERWPRRANRETTLVIIGTGVVGDEIDRLFKAFVGMPQADMPDRVALEQNPLTIPGT